MIMMDIVEVQIVIRVIITSSIVYHFAIERVKNVLRKLALKINVGYVVFELRQLNFIEGLEFVLLGIWN